MFWALFGTVFNIVSSGAKIVKRFGRQNWPNDHREDNRFCAWFFYSLLQIFPKALHSDKQGGGDCMTGLVKTSSVETMPRSPSSLIVSRDSFSPWTWACFQTGGALSTLADVVMYFWCAVFITLHVCVIIFKASPLQLAVGHRPL